MSTAASSVRGASRPGPLVLIRHDDLKQRCKRTRLGFDTSRDERLAAIGEYDHVSGLEVRSRVLKESEIVSRGVVKERVDTSMASVTRRPRELL